MMSGVKMPKKFVGILTVFHSEEDNLICVVRLMISARSKRAIDCDAVIERAKNMSRYLVDQDRKRHYGLQMYNVRLLVGQKTNKFSSGEEFVLAPLSSTDDFLIAALVSYIYDECGDVIKKLSLSPEDLMNRLRTIRKSCVRDADAVEALRSELENQR
jgi:hypothetical protein